MDWLIIISAIVSFLGTFFLVPWFIKYLRAIGMQVKDLNKVKEPMVPLSGGFPVLAGIFAGVLFFVFFEVFFSFGDSLDGGLVILFASLLALLILTLIGFLDDMLIKKDGSESIGLKAWQRILLTFVAAIPFIVINPGTHTMALPFVGSVSFGGSYALILLPLGFVFAANMVNMLAGLNGLESGLGLIYTGMLGAYAFVNGSFVAALILFIAFAALLAFFVFNKYPAKIFPGDSLTYLLGGVLAVSAVIGNIEKAVLIVSIPFIIEFILKLRGKFKVKSYGYEKNGGIHSHHKKIYSLTHLFMGRGWTERQIVWGLMFVELVFASLIWII
jgi:UDP-N-acetylglucosamine--dolichyl-phosphate N-acetylglucosaminephosphotransferase